MMKYIKYILLFVAILLALTLLIFKLYFQYDLPKYIGIQEIPNIKDTVEVYTDKYGVPHIFTNSDEDLFFTVGYIIARERLFQLTLFASVVRGEISSLLGSDYSELDNYIKKSNMFTLKDSTTINLANIELINRYCRGINAWIDESKNELPISFKLLNVDPIQWSETDVFAVASMMTRGDSQENNTIVFIDAIKQYFGNEKLIELFGDEEFEKYSLLINNASELPTKNISVENKILELVGLNKQSPEMYSIIFPKVDSLAQRPKLLFEDFGDFKQPAKWYDVHLNGRNYNVEGSVIPGFPIPIAGRTINNMWAFTGQLDNEAINILFDIASSIQLEPPVPFFNYADTYGTVIISENNSQKNTQNQPQINLIDDIKLKELVNLTSESINQNKKNIVQKSIKIYIDNYPKSNILIDKLQRSINSNIISSSDKLLLNSIYDNLLYNIYFDEFSLVGENIYHKFLQLPEITEQGIIHALNNPKSSWVDDIVTLNYNEGLNDVVIKSIDMSLVEIENNKNIIKSKDDSAVYYRHILGENSAIAKLFNYNIGKIKYSERPVSKSNIRRIFDLSDSSMSYSILSTGQSGLPKSDNYDDQVEMLKNNKIRPIEFNEETIRNSDQYRKLILCPVE